jgi:hypothetical protein
MKSNLFANSFARRVGAMFCKSLMSTELDDVEPRGIDLEYLLISLQSYHSEAVNDLNFGNVAMNSLQDTILSNCSIARCVDPFRNFSSILLLCGSS